MDGSFKQTLQIICISLCNIWLHTNTVHVTGKQIITIGTIIPDDNRRLFSIQRVRPAVDYAIEQVHEQMLIPKNIELVVNYSDSHCNAKDAPVAAFDMKKTVAVFIGPVCDYSLAPVARYAPYWNLPVVTPGGFAHDFANKTKAHDEYRTLTRVGLTFNSLATSIISTANHYNWTKLKLIYNAEGHSEVSPKFCFLAGSAIMSYIKTTSKHFVRDFFKYDPSSMDTETVLRREIGNSFSGEFGWLFNHFIGKC